MFTSPCVSCVKCHVSCVTCHMSRVQSPVSVRTKIIIGGASCWRVCYQRGQPRLVCKKLDGVTPFINDPSQCSSTIGKIPSFSKITITFRTNDAIVMPFRNQKGLYHHDIIYFMPRRVVSVTVHLYFGWHGGSMAMALLSGDYQTFIYIYIYLYYNF